MTGIETELELPPEQERHLDQELESEQEHKTKT